jgi:flavin reductase (DIM6/NTAB) family NADH-FMN oxidoreductase RutF
MGVGRRVIVTIAPHPRSSPAVDGDLFKALLRRHAAAVVVVTAAGEPPAGFTATSFTSVSLDPPLVSFCLADAASAAPVVARTRTVAVHVLHRDQEAAARTFATRGIDRFAAHGAWTPGPDGVPLLDDVAARIICRVTQRVRAGDHTIVLAAPFAGDLHPAADTTPLVYHDGAYTRLSPSAA